MACQICKCNMAEMSSQDLRLVLEDLLSHAAAIAKAAYKMGYNYKPEEIDYIIDKFLIEAMNNGYIVGVDID